MSGACGFTDVDILAFFAGGQFFEEDVEDEILADFTDGQFGIETAVVPSPAVPIAASTGGGGGGGRFNFAVPVAQCWKWDEADTEECEPVSWWGGEKAVEAKKEEDPWAMNKQQQLPIHPGLGYTLVDDGLPEPGRWKTLLVGAAAGIVLFVVAQWAVKAWVRYERDRLYAEYA